MVLKRCFNIIVIGCCWFSASAQSDSIHIRATIVNEKKEPLALATVSIPELKKQVLTDTSGLFELSDMRAGIFTINISLLGYHSLRTKVRIDQQNKAFHFTLKKNTTILEGISVFGYSTTQQTNRQAYNVTAIDARKLHNTTLDIAQVLDRVPGARLRQTGGVGSDFYFSLNGFAGKRIKFFLDGVPMENFGSSFQINNIPVNFAERIEVYKGVVPVWLGSDALGGAVNIITGNKLRSFLDISYAYGSFNTHSSYINTSITSKKDFTFRLNAFQNYSDNDYKITIDAADIRTGRYYPDTKVRRFHDQYHNETAIAQVGFVDKKWADQLLAGITLGQFYKQIQTGATTDATYGAWHEKGNVIMPTLKYRKKDLFTKGLDVVLNANYNFGQDQNIDTVHARYGWLGDSITYRGKGGELWYSFYKYCDNNANATATVIYKINEQHSIALNNVLGFFNRKGINIVSPSDIDNIPQRTNKNILGLSYQYQLNQKWDATIFGKHYSQKANTELLDIDYTRPDDTIYVKTSTNRNKAGYGLAVSYFATTSLQFKLSYEKTNRLPESEELFGDVVYREGNWKLNPESGDNINLGASYSVAKEGHRIYFSATGTYRYVEDFIYDTFNALENKIMAQNLMKVLSTGIESELRYSYKKLLSAGLSLTYQDIRDREKYRVDFPSVPSNTYKERIPNIPYLYGNADAALYFNNVLNNADKVSIGYNMLYVHSFFLYWAKDGAIETKRTIPEQISHDANIVYTLKNGRYNIGVECRNITNAKLYDNFSLQKPGRSFNVKLRYFITQ